MIKLSMQDWHIKVYRSKNKNKKNDLPVKKFSLNKKAPVNINILLNRVRVEKKEEAKKKFFLFSVILSITTFFGIFVFSINS